MAPLWPLENEGTPEATGRGLADSRTQHYLHHHHQKHQESRAELLLGFCYRGNSFSGLSQGKERKKGIETGREGEESEGKAGRGGPWRSGKSKEKEGDRQKEREKEEKKEGVGEKGGSITSRGCQGQSPTHMHLSALKERPSSILKRNTAHLSLTASRHTQLSNSPQESWVKSQRRANVIMSPKVWLD